MNFGFLKGKSFIFYTYQYLSNKIDVFKYDYEDVSIDHALASKIIDQCGKENFNPDGSVDLNQLRNLALNECSIDGSKVTVKKVSEYELSNIETSKNFILIRNTTWKKLDWIPDVIDSKIKRLAFARLGFLSQSGRTSIDNDVVFKNSIDFVLYAPRALQIAFLSPFPSYLINYDGGKIKHIIFSIIFFETLIISLILILFFFNFRYLISKIQVLYIMFICSSNLIIFSSTVNNLGTLFRMRYIFIAFFISIIVCFLLNKKNYTPLE